MKQAAGALNQPFTMRPHQIWQELDTHHKALLTMLYQADNDLECLEYRRLKQEGSCRPSDDWRWIAFATHSQHATNALQTRLQQEMGLNTPETLDILSTLETRGLVRCLQDRWAADDRLFARILFLGQRVVRAGHPSKEA